MQGVSVIEFPRLNEYFPKSRLSVPVTEVNTPAFPVFDTHMHFGKLFMGADYAERYDTGAVVEKLKSRGVTGAVNLDGGSGDDLLEMLEKIGPYRDFIHTFGNVDLSRFEEPGFETYVYNTLRESKACGIKGLKFWKILGLSIKDRQGRFLRPDDARLKPVWQTAAELELPILIHLADPVAFFDPLDATNERFEELCENPDWHFYGEGRYTFEQLMEYQERMIAENPETTFIVAHFGSYSENLAQVGRWLDAYPNMNVDIAMRISELGRQPYTSRKFFEAYADRILFGSDFTPVDMDAYNIYYRFLETMDEYFPYGATDVPGQGRWSDGEHIAPARHIQRRATAQHAHRPLCRDRARHRAGRVSDHD